MATADDLRKDEVRLGADPFPFEKLLAIANKPYSYGIEDLAIACHLSWNQCQEFRRQIRILLRKSSGHIAIEQKRTGRGSKPKYQSLGQALQIWQEDSTKVLSDDCVRHLIYTKAAQQGIYSKIPWKLDSPRNVTVDLKQMARTEMPDPATKAGAAIRMVPCGNYEMQMIYVRAFVNYEMSFMKEHPDARTAGREKYLRKNFTYKGQEPEMAATIPSKGRRKNKRKAITPTDLTITFYQGNSKERETTAHVSPYLSYFLPEPLDHYPAESFPYHQIETEKLWDQARQILDLPPGIDVQRDGWLRYRANAELRSWNVVKGSHVGEIVQTHLAEHKDAETVPEIVFDWINGPCTELTEEFDCDQE